MLLLLLLLQSPIAAVVAPLRPPVAVGAGRGGGRPHLLLPPRPRLLLRHLPRPRHRPHPAPGAAPTSAHRHVSTPRPLPPPITPKHSLTAPTTPTASPIVFLRSSCGHFRVSRFRMRFPFFF